MIALYLIVSLLQDFDGGRTPELPSSNMADSGATVRDLMLGGDDNEQLQEKTKDQEDEVEPCKSLGKIVFFKLFAQFLCRLSG